MILPIDKKYRLAGSLQGWTIDKSQIKKGKKVWQSIRCYSTLEEATKNLASFMVSTSDAKTLIEALVYVETTLDTLCKALVTHVSATGGRT